jgi:Flp pilus assembly protein TadD
LLSQYLSMGESEKALAFARRLTRESPLTARWWKALAHIRLNLGRSEDALCALMIYGYLSPLSREEKKLLADLNLQVGVPTKAAPLYEALMTDKPDKTIVKHLAIAHQQQGHAEKALAYLQKYTKTVKDPELLMLQGDLLYATGRFHQAAEIYGKAAAHSETKGRAWLMAGYAAWQAEDPAQSRKAFLMAAADPKQEAAAREALRRMN